VQKIILLIHIRKVKEKMMMDKKSEKKNDELCLTELGFPINSRPARKLNTK